MALLRFTRPLPVALAAALVVSACGGGDADDGTTSPVVSQAPKDAARMIGVNVLLNRAPDDALLADIALVGKVRDVLGSINALTLQVREQDLAAVRALSYVIAAAPDVEVNGGPIENVPLTSFATGMNTWNLDAVNVTQFGSTTREVSYDGSGVYVAVIDTGLINDWRRYFPQERIAVEHARAFGGGGGETGTVSSQPNKWEHDQVSHGTHVTATILGFDMNGAAIAGVAPGAKVIPVKVVNQNADTWSSVIARGIVYVADLKASGALGASPVVINMSLAMPSFGPLEQAAVDYALAKGVIVVAAAGNSGAGGMTSPASYAPVISVAAVGWTGQFLGGNADWWFNRDVADPNSAAPYYIRTSSSRALAGQQLDVAAPGSSIMGPYQTNNGQLAYSALSGTSMASPHVAGIAALMLQKNAGLGQAQVESILKSSATPLPAACVDVTAAAGTVSSVCWGDDANGAGLVTADGALAATP